MRPATTTTAAAAFLKGASSAYSSSSSCSAVLWAAKMPRVDADLKLDFKDVLFRPKRSSLKSRSEVGGVHRCVQGVTAAVRERGDLRKVGTRRCWEGLWDMKQQQWHNLKSMISETATIKLLSCTPLHRFPLKVAVGRPS